MSIDSEKEPPILGSKCCKRLSDELRRESNIFCGIGVGLMSYGSWGFKVAGLQG